MAVVGGVRSFEAVSAQFGSVLVPLTADGMIIACTALRLAALTRGWRLPGSLLITYGFIAGTVALNVAAAHGWADAVAHALAPVSYAVLVEMLAHLLRLHLRLAQPARPRLSFLTWATSPVVTTRVWLHLARTGGDDPVGRPRADPADHPHVLPAARGLPRPLAARPSPRRPDGRAADRPRRPALRRDPRRPAAATTAAGCSPARCSPSSTRPHCNALHQPHRSAPPPVHRPAPSPPHCRRTSPTTVRRTGSAPTPNSSPNCTGTAARSPAAR